MRNTQHAEPGFALDNALMMSFDLGLAGYDDARGSVFHQQLLERVRALPGVGSAALAELVPLGGPKNPVAVLHRRRERRSCPIRYELVAFTTPSVWIISKRWVFPWYVDATLITKIRRQAPASLSSMRLSHDASRLTAML
ncbi:MAG: hypothetical protein WKF84_09660 [Pyrinomonadaceae bacterium]